MSEFDKQNYRSGISDELNLHDIEKLKSKLQNYKTTCENYLNKLNANLDKQSNAQISKCHRVIISHLFTQTSLLRNMVENRANRFGKYEKSLHRQLEQREAVQNLEIQILKEKVEKLVSDIKSLMNILKKLSNGDNIKEPDMVFESEYSEPIKSLLQKWVQNNVTSETQNENVLSPSIHEINGEKDVKANLKGAPSSNTTDNTRGNDYERVLNPSTANQIKIESNIRDQPTRRFFLPEVNQSNRFGSQDVGSQTSPKRHFQKNYSALSLDGSENKICFCDSPPTCNLSYRYNVHSQHNHLSSQSKTNSKHNKESSSPSDSSTEIEAVTSCPNCQLPVRN